jgi:hypothetical protein
MGIICSNVEELSPLYNKERTYSDTRPDLNGGYRYHLL